MREVREREEIYKMTVALLCAREVRQSFCEKSKIIVFKISILGAFWVKILRIQKYFFWFNSCCELGLALNHITIGP